MRIKILQFRVQRAYSMCEELNLFQMIWRAIFGPAVDHDHHFDVVMKVDPDYEKTARRLEENDFIELPNGCRLKISSIDRFNIIRAKTYKMVKQDLRVYHPMEMYLVYPRVHGRISDVV